MKLDEGEEERCPKASHLTLAGVLKALVKSEKGKRKEKPTRKRKREETTEQPKELAPTTVSKEGASSEEKGDFEAYSEHPVLSRTTNQGTLAPTRAEEIGKQKATTEESSTSELPPLLKEMKEEMMERDEKMREELRWRDNHLEYQIKKREHSSSNPPIKR